jgi:hypothetical protein
MPQVYNMKKNQFPPKLPNPNLKRKKKKKKLIFMLQVYNTKKLLLFPPKLFTVKIQRKSFLEQIFLQQV